MASTPKSLRGKWIVVTRSVDVGKAWGDHLKKHGASVHYFPTIEISPVRPTRKHTSIFKQLDTFAWIIFTSQAGPRATQELMRKMKVALRPEKMPRIAAIGEKTGRAVRKIGWHVAFIPQKATSGALARELPRSNSPILLLRGNMATKELPNALTARGATVVDLSIYKTNNIRKKADSTFLKKLLAGKIDYLTFGSPSAVRGFLLRLEKKDLHRARKIPTIAIGRTVSRVLRSAGFKNIRTAREATIKSMAEAMS